jgi:hypothetical protein
MPKKYTPTLESITVKAKYNIPITDFATIEHMLEQTPALAELGWGIMRFGESIDCLRGAAKDFDKFEKVVRNYRVGIPCRFCITAIEHFDDSTLVDVQCLPVMWYKITYSGEVEFTENQVQEALIECSVFVKQVMSVFKGKEIEPISVYPVIQRTEIKGRLSNLGLKKIVDHLDKAEKHIVQNNFPESLKSSRTAFEKMIDWQMKKRGLEQTNNYKNDLERLKSKGFVDSETTELIQTYYRCLSNIAVHSKVETEPGFYEAQMGYGITLVMLDYFANKLP